MQLKTPFGRNLPPVKPPVSNYEFANKKYVDDSITTHAGSVALHLTSGQNTWLDAITATSAEVNYLSGVTSAIQTQLGNKLGLAGGTLTSFLTLHANPTSNLHAATKQYVDDGLTTKLTTSGGVMSGTIRYDSELNVGNITGSTTVTFTKQKAKVTLTGNVTVTFSFPGVGNYQLKIAQDATGNRTFSYAVTPKYIGSATAPAINTTASSETIMSLYYDGTNTYVCAGKVNA